MDQTTAPTILDDNLPNGDGVNTTLKTNKTTPKLSQRAIAYSLLRKAGLSNTEACEGLKIARSRGNQIANKLDKKYDLREEMFLRPAQLAIKRILKGKTFGEVTQIKDSTVLAAANMVYDRVDPVVKHNVNLNANINFMDVPLDDYA